MRRNLGIRENMLITWGPVTNITLDDFPGSSDGKESACNAEDMSSIPGLGRSPVEENGNPLQYSCLENPMDRGTWPATVHSIAKSQIQTEVI